MSVCEEVMNSIKTLHPINFGYMEEYDNLITKEMAWLDSVVENVEEIVKTGVLPTNTDLKSTAVPEKEPNASKALADRSSTNSAKENEPNISNRITRQTKKSVLALAQQQHNNFLDTLKGVQIKVERITDLQSVNVISDTISKEPISDIMIKEEMLPPKIPPLRNTRRKKLNESSVQVKAELIDKARDRDSDVEIQKQTLDTIILEESIIVLETKRPTRTRTRAAQKNLEETTQIENENSRVTRTKRNKEKNKEPEVVSDSQSTETTVSSNDESHSKKSVKARNGTRDSKIEQSKDNDAEEPLIKKRKVDEFNHLDAHTSTPIIPEQTVNNFNETHVIIKPALLNETVVIHPAEKKEATALNDIMTDDEDIVDASPPRSKRKKIPKTVFSPYETSPIKKKIEAFEKLGSAAKNPVPKASSKYVDSDPSKNTLTGLKTKNISKLFGTPLGQNRLQHLKISSSSTSSNLPIPIHSSAVTSSTGSGLKSSTSKMEFRDRELRRKQKEEALQKKEAMILAQTEEKRKKREEREMKVQQIKAAMEKDKQKQLEAKDEKLKLAQAEKEAKFFKQREELAKKRAAASKRALEAKQNQSKKFIPPYLEFEAPLLPTPDCYDSDDPDRHKVKVPTWQKKPLMSQIQHAMQFVESHKKVFFLSGPRTPNLQSIFPTIEPSKLKRTSSAIWNETEFTILENMTEDEG